MATLTSQNPDNRPHRPRMPKLTYRSAPAAIGSEAEAQQPVLRQPPPPIDTDCSPSSFPPEPALTPATRDLLHLQPPITPTPAKPPKTKQKGALKGLKALVSTREPSSLAFAQLEEQARKHQAATLKNEKRPPARLNIAGVSNSKLPPTVPRVNSKWDGLPEPAKVPKEKERSKDGSHSRPRADSRPSGRSSESSSRASDSRSRSRPRTSKAASGSSSQASKKRLSNNSGSTGSRSRSDSHVAKNSISSNTLTYDSSITASTQTDDTEPDSAPPPIAMRRGEVVPPLPKAKPEIQASITVTPKYPLDLRRNNSLISMPERPSIRSPTSPTVPEMSEVDPPKTSKAESTSHHTMPRPTPQVSSQTASAVARPVVVRTDSERLRDKAVAPWEEPESIFGPQCEAPVIRQAAKPAPQPSGRGERADKADKTAPRKKDVRRSRLGFFRQ